MTYARKSPTGPSWTVGCARSLPRRLSPLRRVPVPTPIHRWSTYTMILFLSSVNIVSIVSTVVLRSSSCVVHTPCSLQDDNQASISCVLTLVTGGHILLPNPKSPEESLDVGGSLFDGR